MSYILDMYETIELQNSKSKEILEEYERIANEKRIKYKKEEEDLVLQNDLLEKKINKKQEEYENVGKNKSLKSIDRYKLKSDLEDELEELKEYIHKNNVLIETIQSRDIYPHGNGINGFALAYYQISQKINVEWKEFIYTYTILGYKKVYPEDAIKYIQYKKDIETSGEWMKKMEKSLFLKNQNYSIFYWEDWKNIINEYIKENNIILDENIIFRPSVPRDILNDKDKPEYYTITKSDLEYKEEDNQEEDMDFLDVLELLKG